MTMLLLVLIILHTPDGHFVEVNPEQITTMNGPKGKSLIVEGAHCMINLTDGKFVAVKENCDEVKQMIGEK